MGDDVVIRFCYVNEEDIVRTKSGKFTLIISKLNIGRLPDQFRTFDQSQTAVA